MKLWILSHLKTSPGNRLVIDAATRAGHDVELVAPAALALEIRGGPEKRLTVIGPYGALPLPDMVFTRMGGSAPEHTFDALRQLEEAGIPAVNSATALEFARDKVRSFQRLAVAGLPLPATVVLGREAPVDAAGLEVLGPPPWIVKLPRSSQGMGVACVDSLASLRSVADMLRALDQRVLVQHYVREASGMDIRVLVVGGEAIAAMRREASGDDEIRSNLHRGGTAEEIGIPPDLEAIAVKAASALGLDVAGVDLLPSKHGPVVAEVNGSPGLAGLEDATGRDLAGLVVEYLASRLQGASGD